MSGNLLNVQIYTCRICLDTKFSESILLNAGSSWLEMYEYCFGLNLSDIDVPKILCATCGNHLREFAEFKKKGCHSDQLWRSIVNNEAKCFSDKCQDVGLSLVKQEDRDEDNEFELHEPDVRLDSDVDPSKSADHWDEAVNNKNDDTSTTKVQKKEGKTKKKKPKKKNKDENPVFVINSELGANKLCGLCDFSSPDAGTVTQHIEDHGTNNELRCQLCGFEGLDFAVMVVHRFKHFRRGKRRPGRCHVCGAGAGGLRLQFHYRAQHLRRPGGLCHCGDTFTSYKAWWRHMRLHMDVKRYICDHCGRVYLYRAEIEDHWVNVFNKKKYICDICGRGHTKHSNLKSHMSAMHPAAPVRCSHCGGSFKNQQRLDHHLKRLTMTKEFVCKVCSKAFYTARHLRLHEFWHTGERPHPCEICGKSYKNKSQLTVHIKRHRGICEFKCGACPKSFVTSSQLRVHGAAHAGARRHACAACRRTFHSRVLLRAHEAARHQQNRK